MLRTKALAWSLGFVCVLLCCSASSRPIVDDPAADEPRLEMTKTFGHEPGERVELAFRRADADSPWMPVTRNQRPGVIFGPDRLWMPEQARRHLELDDVQPYVTLRAFDPERSLDEWQRISVVNVNGGRVLAVLLWRGGYVGEVHLAGTTILEDWSDLPDHETPCAFYRQSCESGDTFGCQLWFAACSRMNGEPAAEEFDQACQQLLRNCQASELGACVSFEVYCEGAEVSNPLDEAPIADLFYAIEQALSAHCQA